MMSMTSRERIVAALALQPVDVVPVFPRDLTLGMDLTGFTTPEVCCADGNYDAEKSAASVLALQTYAGHDAVVGSIHDVGLDTDLIGGTVLFAPDEPPAVAAPPIRTHTDLDRARAANLWGGRWPGYVAAHRRVGDAIGYTVAVVANIEGPVTKASMLRGMEQFAFDLLADRAFAADVLDFATDLIGARMHALVDAGAQVLFLAAACDNPWIIGPDRYVNFVLPALRRIVAAADARGVPTVFHPHGTFTRPDAFAMMEATINTGIRGFQFAEQNDLGVAKARWGDRICILGGLDVCDMLLPGPPERIAEATRRCIDEVGRDGFILMASCSLHRGMDPAHLRAMVRAAHACGR